jgi:cobalt-zinc-cadmium resistance protein CzcA
MGLELSDVFITLTPRERWTRATTQDELVREMRACSRLPGMRAAFTQPIEMRVNEMVAGVRADVGVKLFGDDFDVLRAEGREIERALEGVPGAADVTPSRSPGCRCCRSTVDRDAHRAPRHRRPRRARGRRGARHLEVGTLQDGERRFPIACASTIATAGRPAIGRILVTAPAASACRSRGSRGSIGRGPVDRSSASGEARRIVVQANVRGRDVGSFVADARRALARVELPPGYYVRSAGSSSTSSAPARLMIVVPIALLLIFALLYATYGRALDALRVFTGVPFAAVGRHRGAVAPRDAVQRLGRRRLRRALGRRGARRHGAGVRPFRAAVRAGRALSRPCAKRRRGGCGRC